MNNEIRLHVVMYHYVRDGSRSRFPRLKGIAIDDFRRQVAMLAERYEMASLDSALEFLHGKYRPERDLCLLTFDDGLRDHYAEVMPVLSERRIGGLFFIITSCIEQYVSAVHKNHLLMALLDFEEYKNACIRELTTDGFAWPQGDWASAALQSYRWDTPDVAGFKYVMSRLVPEDLKNRILDRLFVKFVGDEQAIARELYMTWSEVVEMKAAGMTIGGHSHRHNLLARLPSTQLEQDLAECANALRTRLGDDGGWAFSYPYGRSDSFTDETVACLQRRGFRCGFSTVPGSNAAGQDVFHVRRVDPKDV